MKKIKGIALAMSLILITKSTVAIAIESEGTNTGFTEVLDGNDNLLIGDEELLVGDDELIGGDDNLLLEDDDLIGGDDGLLGGNDDLVGGDDGLLGGDDDLIGGNDDLTGQDDDLIGGGGIVVGPDEELIPRPTTPQLISLGTWVKSSFYKGNQVKLYEFTIPSNGYIDIKFKKEHYQGIEIDWWMVLSNIYGAEFINDGADSLDHDGNYITYRIGLRRGTYQLELEMGLMMDNNTYYTDIIIEHTPSTNFEYENNDTLETAQSITVNQIYGGISHEDRYNLDYFKFTTQETGDITFKIAHDINEKFFDYNFYNSNGVKFNSLNERYDMKLVGGYYTYTFKNLPAGTYTFGVDAYNYNIPYEFIIDVPTLEEHWAYREIKYAMDSKWVNTTSVFRPNDAITRAEFVKIVNKAFGFTSRASNETFSDVDSDDWWYNEVLIAIKAGYITTKNKEFRPNDPITREEVAAIITTIERNKDTNLDKLQNYTDRNLVSNWALSSVEGAIEAGYMGKNSTMFNPKKNITRAEAIVTLYRVVN